MRVEVSNNNNNNIKANKKQKLHNMQRQIKGKGKSNSKLKTELKRNKQFLKTFIENVERKLSIKTFEVVFFWVVQQHTQCSMCFSQMNAPYQFINIY